MLCHIAAFVRQAQAAALHLGWPVQCVGCGVVCGEPICGPCTAACVPNMGCRCRFCDDASAQTPCARCRARTARPVSAARGAFLYQGPIKSAILAGKHRGEEGLWSHLAALMAADTQAQSLLRQGRLLVPIPLAPARRWQRGYNPSAQLARALASRSGLEVAHVLRRKPGAKPQSRLSAKERCDAIQNAFDVTGAAAKRVGGNTVVLVDDVITTGATLHAAAQALKAAGAKRVLAMSVARQTLSHGKPASTPL